MFYKKILFISLFFIGLVFSQIPIELAPNEVTEPINFNALSDTEYLISISAISNTDWSIPASESATIVISLDGDWNNYNQDIILYAGQNLHTYHMSLGPVSQGEHTIQLKFDHDKSSPGSSMIFIESIELIDITSLDLDRDVLLHSPIMYGRDLLSWNESTYTDIPLIMWHEITQEGNNKAITYSIIFSNEDSRVGVGLADLMVSYGRTTDIEWVYEVLISPAGDIINEIFQGPSHTTTNFEGNKIGRHPILKNATLNCNFSDNGVSNYKFFLSPKNSISHQHTREILMDENPWSYKIMAQELINENRYELEADPYSVEISDVRNYLYIEYEGDVYGNNITLELVINFHNNCDSYLNHHNYPDFFYNYNGGISRTSIELYENFNPIYIKELGFLSNGNNEYSVNINSISKLFYLDINYIPIEIDISIDSFSLSNYNPEYWIQINNNMHNIDCFGQVNGEAICDNCNICNGNDLALDDCEVCFGNNMDMDCEGVCFGNSIEDACGVCDDNIGNDNLTCSGCTDINAENYSPNALFFDNSCEYSDQVFHVPNEYNLIQDAIFYSSSGDTVEVGPGIYNENINFLDKGIVLKSQYQNIEDINNYVINGIDSMSTISIEDINDNSAVIGFTITNGYGRGISFEDFISMAADEEAFDSLITNVIRGGGISISNSSPYLRDLHIRNNIARNVGAGIGLINSNSIIERCTISDNNIPDGDALGGGGIAINGGNPTIIDSKISNNLVGHNLYSLNGGGGILCGFSFDNEILQLNLINTELSGNEANIGAGIGALSGNLFVEHTLIYNNIGDFGSAISLGEPLGLAINDIYLQIINSTIVSNIGTIGLGLINSSHINAVNSIFWDNGDIEFSPLPNNNELNIDLNYCNTNDVFAGEGNIISDPLFTDSENFNFSLLEFSSCIDAGTSDINMDGVSDIENFFGLAPDIGYMEYEPTCSGITGDINFDSEVNILDIVQMSSCILDLSCDICLDLNSDNIINILDIINLVNIILY